MSSALLVVAVLVVAVALVVALKARYDLRSHLQRFRWTDEDLRAARQDSLTRSHMTVSGKVQEHLAPLFPGFCDEFSPRDARFLGSPVDFVVFDGLDSGEIAKVVFLEVKTGRSALSARERQVRDAIEQGKVEWRLLRLGSGLSSARSPGTLGPARPTDIGSV
ncbi:MAG: Holliday junction resolvase-like protein [Acidimicrobiales bacterium]|jgi:predicted Holliday junction resolvase-like endonuclease